MAQGDLVNPSFEEGQTAPTGWRARERGGSWRTGTAHSGNRYLSGRLPRGGRVWESELIAVQPQTDYRLEGWLRCSGEEARFRGSETKIGVDLLNERGQVVRFVDTPRVRSGGGWQYAAAEWNSDRAKTVRVWFWIKGLGDLDDVNLAPVAASYMGNKGVEGDERGRIPFWSEEKENALLPGRREGQFRLDADVKREGKASVLLTPAGDWCAVSSVNYPVPAWTNKLELSAWARCEKADPKAKNKTPPTAQILACWMDDRQKVLSVEASAPVHDENWQRIALTVTAPPQAATVRLVAAARGGRAWFDDFDLLLLRPQQRVVRVLVNQVGYELAGPKTAVVAANFFPLDGPKIECKLLAPDGKVALKQEVLSAGRIHSGKHDDWGWYFWRADFSAFREAGAYRIAAQVGEEKAESAAFVVGQGALLDQTAQSAVDFFFIQRCGFEAPHWHTACHLDDAKLPDGTHVDATGGWHSAGDYNKPMWQFGDGGAVYALASAYAANPLVFNRFDRDHDRLPDALDEAWWGAKFLAKMQNPTDGSMRGDVLQGPGRDWMKWTAPDVHTDNKIGTADDPVIAAGMGNTPLTVASWASLGRHLTQRGVNNDYAQRAQRLWDFLSAQKDAAANPLLLIGALEMFHATGDVKYQEFMRSSVERLLQEQKSNGRFTGDTGDHGDVTAAALALFALDYPKDPLRPRLMESLKKYLDFCLSRADNPFGLSRQGVEENNTSFFHPTVGLGVNFWLLGRAWAALLIHRLTNDGRALTYAVDQMDWVLGKNPYNLCLFESKGAFNPPRYHHRYNMIPGRERGAVPGTIPNGFVRDMGLADRPGFDMSRGGNRSPSFRTSEPWLVHNLFYLLAASALHREVGEAPALSER
jgi:hypothetical protein